MAEAVQKNKEGSFFSGVKTRAKKTFDKLKKVKHIEIYLAVGVLVVILLIYFSTNPFGKKSATDTPNTGGSNPNAYDYCLETEKKLTSTLSKIKGVGKVEVMINFESTPEIVIAYITSITNNNGNSSSTSSPQIILQGGNQLPIILKTVFPKVLGVLVVAEGAGDAKVKLDLYSAVKTVFDVNSAGINVFPMNKGGK